MLEQVRAEFDDLGGTGFEPVGYGVCGVLLNARPTAIRATRLLDAGLVALLLSLATPAGQTLGRSSSG